VELLTMRLEARGFDVTAAGSGEHALRSLAEQPADVVVLDIRLPGMDGIRTLVRIKAEHPATQVIMVTGFAHSDMLAEVQRRGAFTYLMKPVDIDELLEQIRRATQRNTS